MRARCGWVAQATILCLWLFCCVPLQAQPTDSERMLLLVVPASLELNGLRVERFVDLLKLERERLGYTPADLPILRLSQAEPAHQTVLARLGLTPVEQLQTYTCTRDARGWPVSVVRAHSAQTSPDLILSQVGQPSPPLELEGSSKVGLLLVGRQGDREVLDTFLKELGGFWLSRYGRVRPSPYPLASYDLDAPEVATSLETAFPELTEEPPLVALCWFEGEQPSQVLKLYRALDTPATLVRELSAARTQALELSAGPSALATAAPGAQAVGLSGEQERALLVSRLLETGRQLWSAAESDERRADQPAKRLLLKVIEESRRYLDHDQDEGAWLALQESLRDYAVEPLTSDEPRLVEAQARFLFLGKTLLAAP